MRLLPVLVLLLLVPGAAGLPWERVPTRPPFADFVWSPASFGVEENVTFVSMSSDMDGIVVASRWYLPGDGPLDLRIGATMTTTFSESGTFPVTLEVTDNTLLVSRVTHLVTVLNQPPTLDMIVDPSPTYRGVPVSFTGLADDPEGDDIVSWSWDLGDGSVADGQEASHTYGALGVHTITLFATDEGGNGAFVSRALRVLNRPPHVTGDFAPRSPLAGQAVQFAASGVDPDLPGGDVSFSWQFSDGPLLTGQQVSRAFDAPGNYSVTLRGQDAEGATSQPYMLVIQVA